RGFNDAPYFLCEYAHAMGVGPGSLEDYWKLIYAHDIFLGGCIWEFADHAVYHAETDSFTYGGDHGEFIHDGNFCVDGLFRPFRNPSSGALNMKNVYRPIRANHISGNSYEFVNTNRFKNADYLTIVWKLQKAGEVVEQNKITLDIPPCKHKTISIMHANIDEINEYQILFEYYDKDMLVGFEQIILAHKIFNMVDVAGDISIVKSGNLLKVNPSDNVNIIFDKKSGFLTDYVINGVSLLNQTPSQYLGIMPVLYRAPLDNDMNIKKSWTKLNYDKANFTKNYFSYKYKKGIVTVKAVYAFNAKFGGQFMDVKYQIDDNGVITVTVKYSNLLFGMPPLAKVGLSFEMPKEFDQIEYYGLGDSESLPDFTAHTYLGLFKTDVAKMKEWYIKPQDSGYRCDVRYAKITNGKKLGLQIFNQNAPFIFNARHNTMQDLLKAKHHNELTDSPTTLINIDGFIRGTGSNSCGPAPLAKYCLNKRRYDYAFKI
ncbi:MAG: glycoside hydrolase family 2 TIM barrel-domain containing protein, partial [Clostridia bacterium]